MPLHRICCSACWSLDEAGRGGFANYSPSTCCSLAAESALRLIMSNVDNIPSNPAGASTASDWPRKTPVILISRSITMRWSEEIASDGASRPTLSLPGVQVPPRSLVVVCVVFDCRQANTLSSSVSRLSVCQVGARTVTPKRPIMMPYGSSASKGTPILASKAR